MRRALIVGVPDKKLGDLCVNDAKKMHKVLSTNYDSSPNFGCKLMTSEVKRTKLMKQLDELFKNPADACLFYFSGHGTLNNRGGYLVTEDVVKFAEGVSMDTIINYANESPVHEVNIVIDCCYGGNLGGVVGLQPNRAILSEGVSILTSSLGSQVSIAKKSGSVFTSLIYQAMQGAGSDIFGRITMASVYNFIDQALGPWEQRPMYKANVTQLGPLRQCLPKIDRAIIRKIPVHFKKKEDYYKLDPSYDTPNKEKEPEKVAVYEVFMELRNFGMLEPVDVEHLFHAVEQSKSCRLTDLGQYYWDLVKKEFI